MNKLHSVGGELLPAIAYGDAAGLPVETWSAEEIQQKFGYIGELIPTEANPYFAGVYDEGTWSDDTQLSAAVAEALIETGFFDIDSLAKKHIDAHESSEKIINRSGVEWPLGWGNSTTMSVRRLAKGLKPLISGEPSGSGNGVLMKIAPLAYWQIASNVSHQKSYEQSDELTNMTHASPEAMVCSRVHLDVLRELYHPQYSKTIANLGIFAVARALYHEQATNSKPELSPLLRYLTVDSLDTEGILESTDGKGFYAPQTLAMSYGAFLAGRDFSERVYSAVNLGGDTDSTASIVAAMSVFRDGNIEPLPNDFHKVKDLQRLKNLSVQLAQAALGQ